MNYLFNYTAEILEKYDFNKQEVLEILETPNANMGDVALPCFKFAKNLKKSPMIIAEELQKTIKDKNLTEIKAVNGFLNFFFKPDFIAKYLLENVHLTQDEIAKNSGFLNKTMLIEHTSTNPNASPHVGRARNAIIADCLVRVCRFLGWKTDVHYYVNDMGKQIAMIVYATKNLKEVTFKNILQIYIDINQKIKDNPELEKEIFNLLYKFESGDKETVKMFNSAVDICVKGQIAIYNKLGICWDKFDYESKYIDEHITDEVLEKLKQTNKLFKDENNRWVLNQKDEPIGIENPMLVLTRQDGTSLYGLRDICYSIDKAKLNADKNLIVLGEDQKVYFKQISAALKLLGYRAPEVVHYSFILLPSGKMSTRNGTVVLLEDFMREITEKCDEVIKEKRGTSDKQKAQIVGYGALKYGILKSSPDKNVIFDWNNALNFEGNSSVYSQYNYARINSILKKADVDYKKADFSVLTAPEETALIKQLAIFEDTLLSVYNNLNPSTLTTYVFNLTSKFSQFYSSQKILNCPDEKLKIARLNLIQKVGQTIKDCLYLLGIDTVDEF